MNSTGDCLQRLNNYYRVSRHQEWLLVKQVKLAVLGSLLLRSVCWQSLLPELGAFATTAH